MIIDYSYAPYFSSTYTLVILFLSLIAYNKWQRYSAARLIDGRNTSWMPMLAFVLLLIVLIGLRPHSGRWFGDTSTYARNFHAFESGDAVYDPDSREWCFNLLMSSCARVMSCEWFFTVVDAGYFGFMLIAAIRLYRNNAWGGMLFLLGAFSTFSYATNGIRNGLACSIILVALSLAVTRTKRNLIIAGVACCFAMAIHKSTTLPVVCFVAAYFFRSTKMAICFWGLSIVLCLVAHGAIESFFSSLGFDDRMSGYLSGVEKYARLYKSGFRPDFLIYSAMPIWLAYHVLVKKRITDTTYLLIANTYIYANSFWVMLMQATYSNRFAYLSWFMLPVVLAYPCLRMNVWGNRQGKVAAKIMLAHVGFTAFMHFIYY